MNDEKDRELIQNNIKNSYGKLGTIFFSLNGSPPKGYAMYIIERNIILFYDSFGKNFKEIKEMEIVV
jgi:hypothetical protein